MKTIMAMVDKYGQIVCELEPKDDPAYGMYGVPTRKLHIFSDMLMEGDEYRIEAVEIED